MLCERLTNPARLGHRSYFAEPELDSHAAPNGQHPYSRYPNLAIDEVAAHL